MHLNLRVYRDVGKKTVRLIDEEYRVLYAYIFTITPMHLLLPPCTSARAKLFSYCPKKLAEFLYFTVQYTKSSFPARESMMGDTRV